MHQIDKNWTEAWPLVRVAAKILKQKFGARKVVVFGSLLKKDRFSPWSDIDLAVWGDIGFKVVCRGSGGKYYFFRGG
ncbi:MAG: nucleotidyltransferase domain-containing protein [Pseudomonadota bacterium]